MNRHRLGSIHFSDGILHALSCLVLVQGIHFSIEDPESTVIMGGMMEPKLQDRDSI